MKLKSELALAQVQLEKLKSRTRRGYIHTCRGPLYRYVTVNVILTFLNGTLHAAVGAATRDPIFSVSVYSLVRCRTFEIDEYHLVNRRCVSKMIQW